MLKIRLAIFIVTFLIMLAGCSGGDSVKYSESSNDTADSKLSEMNNPSEESISFSDSKGESAAEGTEAKQGTTAAEAAVQRMVIFNAELNLRVKNFAKARDSLEKKAKMYNGYIVHSNSNRYDGEQQSGTMTFRIPQEHFHSFLNDAEGLSVQVNSREVSGQDVTEEYVDLGSRLKSKRAVESRLLDFMNKAGKTEDLLKISSDLAEVQEEIEQISGRIKFLENQTALSTVTIMLEENAVAVPKIENENLNTWQKVKKQFADNINILLSLGSGLIVFLVGNLPILLLVALVIGVIVYLVKKNTGRPRDNNIDSNS